MLLLFLTLSCIACKKSDGHPEIEKVQSNNEMAFDKTKWNTKNGSDYIYRDKMLKNLLFSDQLKKLKKQEVIGLLGEPTRTDEQYLFYTIAQERIGFFPLHTKTLVVKLLDDDSVEKVMVHK